MKITISIRGTSALDLKTKELIEAARAGLKFGVSEAAMLVETEAKAIVPVVSGRLRDSIHTETILDADSRQQLRVAPDTPYAARIEWGFSGTDSLGRHYHQAPEPYMRPAVDAKRDEAITAIKDGVYGALDAAQVTR